MIEVDLSKFMPPGRYDAIIEAILPDVVEQVRTRIIAMAQEELGQSAEDYVQGVQPAVYYFPSGGIPPGNVTIASIALVGMVPNMIERGFEGGDMKPKLLMGPNVRVTKDGKRMNVVPFRHSTPNSKGRVAPRMGSAEAKMGMATEEAARIGKTVHSHAKRLTETFSGTQLGTVWGSRLKAGLAPKLRPHHKSDIYAGMVRETKVYKTAKQSQYTTFRAVSDNSDPEAWIHPGIKAHKFFERAAGEIDKIVPKLLNASLRGAGE